VTQRNLVIVIFENQSQEKIRLTDTHRGPTAKGKQRLFVIIFSNLFK